VLSTDNSTRRRSLDAALAVLQADGLEGLTTRAVAERAGLTQPALYRHFRDKDELVREVLREVQALFRDRLVEALSVEGADTRLRAALDAFRAFAVDRPHLFDALFVRPPSGRETPAETAARPGTIFRLLVDRVVECMHAGELRDDDPVSVALTLAAHAQGLVLLYRRGRLGDARAFARFYVASLDRLLAGLR
jgi:AcrR family transcriptional regulator